MLDLTSVGRSNGPELVEWGHTDSMIYALSVGASQNQVDELYLSTENTAGEGLKVLPSFGVVLGIRVPRPDIGPIDRSRVVHAEQHFEITGTLPASGSALVTTSVTDIHDKGSGALVWTESVVRSAVTGQALITSRAAIFIKGEGGFGGGTSSQTWEEPSEQPDLRLGAVIRPEQALVYRLNGDRNPLHSDPAYAKVAGFDRPILHGLCTFGIVCRLLVGALVPGRPEQLVGMGGRFSAPVWPGDEITVDLWHTGGEISYRTRRSDGTIIIDRGWARVTN